jgi:hypothetical protein
MPYLMVRLFALLRVQRSAGIKFGHGTSASAADMPMLATAKTCAAAGAAKGLTAWKQPAQEV